MILIIHSLKADRMKFRYFLIIILALPPGGSHLLAQGKIEGKIFDASDSDETGLPGASIYWAGTTSGTYTNAAGYFELKKVKQTSRLVVSFIGYKPDTIDIDNEKSYIKHGLSQQNEISEIVITGKATGSHIDKMSPILTMNITGAELRKAACCNLSESFETNASVDVNYTDAATGAKQIQLLGLSGIYTQILAENIPTLYGISTAYGLSYIPGPWMESIQVSKGTSSVRNGYESIAGQINVEYKKPAESEKLYINGFMNDAGRQEFNFNGSVIINDKLSTMVMAHAERQKGMKDKNADGYRDEPDINQYHFFNRWDYLTPKGDIRAGIKYLEEERLGGQYSYNRKNPDTWSEGFGILINSRRLEAFSKAGRIFLPNGSMSIGWINNYSYHSQESFFGNRHYDGKQNSFYSSLLYQWQPQLGNHTIDAGFSYKYDNYDESLDNVIHNRMESVPGAFFQYTYSDSSKFTLITGIRTDYHNLYGLYVTPRIHLKYSPSPYITIRGSAGKGYRSGNVLAENSYLLASSREIKIADDLREEEALNYGASITAELPVRNESVKISVEAFRTSFINQIITDLDADPDEIRFYNLNGESYSNVFQVEVSTQLMDRLDLLAAWRWNDVKMTIDNILRSKPLNSRYKGLFTASYLTRLRKWQYDYTLQVNGPGRIPSTASNPEMYRRSDSFRAFTVMNAQITRYFKKFQFYLGGENLLDFRQHDPVIAADDPFGEYFDSGLIWGPVHGRKIYAGFRFIINSEHKE